MKFRNRRFGFVLGALACASLAAAGLANGNAKVKASPPPPSELKLPVIIRVVARPLCTGLHHAVGPAIQLMLQNNAIIAKSQPLFDDYVRYNTEGKSGAAARQLAQVKMDYLVGPLVKNTQKIDSILADANIFNRNTGGDANALAQIKAGLLHALSMQKTALDLINGFVATKQLAYMQHSGFEYISAINSTNEIKNNPFATPTPNSSLYNENYAGLAPRQVGQKTVNFNNLPGLSLGYNPIRAVAGAMRRTRTEMVLRQNQIAPKIIAAARVCSAGATHPKTP